MLKKGIYIDDFLGKIRRASNEDYHLFEVDIIIGEYSIGHYESFLDDFKNALSDFEKIFTFLKLTKIDWIARRFIDESINIETETNISTSIAYESFGTEAFLEQFFDDDMSLEFLGLELSLVYENINKEVSRRRSFGCLCFAAFNKNGQTILRLSLDWYLGSEWFYNEYRVENSQKVIDAIIKFYEIREQYKDLKIEYHLAGFDLDLEKYTSKKVEKF